MDQNIQLNIIGNNLAAGALQQVHVHLTQIQGDLKETAERAERATNAFKQFQSGLSNISSGLSPLASLARQALGEIRNLLSSLIGTVENLARSILDTLIGAFQTLLGVAERVATVVGGALVAALVAVGVAGVEMNVAISRAHIALTAITGSAKTADTLIGQLRQTALTTQFTFKELIPIGQQLAAAYGAEGVGKVIPTILAFDNAMKVLGADQEHASLALLGFRKLLQEEGGPKEREIREIDINLPGAGVRDTMRQAFGSADTQTLQKAGVTGAQVADAIVASFQQRFGAAGKLLGQSLPVVLSNFVDAFNDIAASVTQRFTPMLAGALSKILAIFSTLSQNEGLMRALSVPFELLGRAVEIAAAKLPAFIEWLEGILTRENVVGILSSIVAFFQTLYQEVMRFIGAATGGGGLAAVWEAFRKAAETAIDFVLRVWNGLVAAVSYFAEHSGELWGAIRAGINDVIAGVQVLIGAVEVLFAALAAQRIAAIVGGLFRIGEGLIKILGAGGAALGMGGGAAAGGAGAAGGGAAAAGGITAGGAAAAVLGTIKPIPSFSDPSLLARLEKFFGLGGGQAATSVPAQAPGTAPGGAPAGPGGGGGIGGSNVPQFGGAAGWLQRMGAGTMGALGGFGTSALQQIPDFFQGGINAFKRGYDQGGIGGFMDEFKRNQQAAAAGINAFLGPTGSGQAPRPDVPVGGMGGAKGGAAPIFDPKALKEQMAAWAEFYDAQTQAAKSAIDALPQAERAQAEIAQLIPMLVEKQNYLKQAASLLDPNTKEYWQQVDTYWKLQGQIASINERGEKEREAAEATAFQQQAAAVNAMHDANRKAGQNAQSLAEAQLGLAEAQLKNVPGLGGQARGAMLLPFLLARFRALSRPLEGEDEIGALQRMTQAEGLRGQIAESLGMNRGGTARLLGGGQMNLSDPRRPQLWRQLDRIQQQSASQGPIRVDVPATVVNVEMPLEVWARKVAEKVEADLLRWGANAWPGSGGR